MVSSASRTCCNAILSSFLIIGNLFGADICLEESLYNKFSCGTPLTTYISNTHPEIKSTPGLICISSCPNGNMDGIALQTNVMSVRRKEPAVARHYLTFNECTNSFITATVLEN